MKILKITTIIIIFKLVINGDIKNKRQRDKMLVFICVQTFSRKTKYKGKSKLQKINSQRKIAREE